MNCIQPSAPALEMFIFVPKAVSILLIPANTCHGKPYWVPQAWQIGSKNGGIWNWLMMNEGAPIRAGPTVARMKLELVLVGTPFGSRGGGSGPPCCEAPPPRRPPCVPPAPLAPEPLRPPGPALPVPPPLPPVPPPVEGGGGVVVVPVGLIVAPSPPTLAPPPSGSVAVAP